MTVTVTIEIKNDKGRVEISNVTHIHNLDGKEAHDTALDISEGVLSAISGFHPETGEILPTP